MSSLRPLGTGCTVLTSNTLEASQGHVRPPVQTWQLSMDAISFTAARANQAQTMKRVCADHDPLIITRNGEHSVVMLSLDDFKALEETAYLLRSPRNARRLMDAVDSLEAGRGQDHVLAE